MALYLVEHTPGEAETGVVDPPTRLLDLASAAGGADANPRWVTTYAPDLHDDRIFTLWEADNGADIVTTMAKFGFLTHLKAHPIRVQSWGPAEVLAEDG